MVVSLTYNECLLNWQKCNYNSSEAILEMNNYLPIFFTLGQQLSISCQTEDSTVDLNKVEKNSEHSFQIGQALKS